MNEKAGAPPRGETVQVKDLELHYHDHGAQGKKGTVVFVHGSGPGASGHSNFKGNVDCLTCQGLDIHRNQQTATIHQIFSVPVSLG